MSPQPAAIGSTVLGYPRIGPARELKRAVEAYWAGALDQADLERTAAGLRAQTWRRLTDLGLSSVPSSFSYYDQVLDASALVGALPPRVTALDLDPLDAYFAAARGTAGVAPLELTKWFDTNYHYLVPEIAPETAFTLSAGPLLAAHREAVALGIITRPVVVGPVSFLLLSKAADDAPDDFDPLSRLDDLVEVYAELLAVLHAAEVDWVQLDEPAFVTDRTDSELAALRRTYDRLGGLTRRPAILSASYFGRLGPALPELAATPVEAIAVDLVAGDLADLRGVADLSTTTVVAGVVDGRNIWRTDLDAALDTLDAVRGITGHVAVSTSCSLLHVPYDVEAETHLDPVVRGTLAFAEQKVGEVVTLARAVREGRAAVTQALEASRSARAAAAAAPGVIDDEVRARAAAVRSPAFRRRPYEERAAAQRQLGLPQLPTTTIGSFPQTDDVRATRAAFRAGRIDRDAYTTAMRAEIERVIRLQEKLGLDVLVHGEPERNDMVQYFAEQLDGFVTTRKGWVQSYGSRCVRPPILYGDVSRPEPITVPWATHAQSLTDRPVKGMLTGPVTILAWSFVRDDQPLADTALQVALAIRDETVDLEAAGLAIIQVDEPALRELLPLRRAERSAYLEWSVAAFRLATSGVRDETQVHTHLCYSEFAAVVDAIDGLDADVTSIEAARSGLSIVEDVAGSGFGRGIGPGVYDIHSPRVPSADEVTSLLRRALGSIPAERLWVNPDCGLKTRRYAEVEPALAALVEATATVRAALPLP